VDGERLGRVIDAVRVTQPGLILSEQMGVPVLRGEFLVSDGEAVVERYAIEVLLVGDSERALPAIREVGGRIPRIADRHVSHDGTLCVVQPAAYWFAQPRGLPLAEFLEGPVRSHLAMQALVERGEDWPAGEWGHGADGIAECFSEILGVKDPTAVKALVEIIAGERMKGHLPCPCGRGRKFRKCHGPVVFTAQRNIPLAVREQSSAALRGAEARRGSDNPSPAVARGH
jgi:SEC-C motif